MAQIEFLLRLLGPNRAFPFPDQDLKEQARLWLLMCAFLNICIASFTVCSFWIDRHRFAFPER